MRITSPSKHTTTGRTAQILPLGLLLTMFILVAQPSLAQRPGTAGLDRLTQQLELTDAQAAKLKKSLGDDAQPTNLWAVAAALQGTLTAEQKAKLLDQGKVAGAYAKGVRDGRAARASRAGAGRTAAPRAGRAAAPRAGRAAAPGTGRAAQAQAQGRVAAPALRAQRGGMGRAGNMSAIEGLTDEQKAKMQTLRTEQQAKMQALVKQRRDGGLTDEQFTERSEALRAEGQKSMRSFLTPGQAAKLDSVQAARPARGATAGRGGNAVAPGARRQGVAPGVRGQGVAPGARGQGVAPGVRGQGVAPGVRGQGVAPVRGSQGMTEALNLSKSQQETVQIHRALTALMVAPRMGARAGARGMDAPRRAR